LTKFILGSVSANNFDCDARLSAGVNFRLRVGAIGWIAANQTHQTFAAFGQIDDLRFAAARLRCQRTPIDRNLLCLAAAKARMGEEIRSSKKITSADCNALTARTVSSSGSPRPAPTNLIDP
jgi:hypothetical protein